MGLRAKLLLLVLGVLAWAGPTEELQAERLRALKGQLRKLRMAIKQGAPVPPDRQYEALEEIARLRTLPAQQYLAEIARNPLYADIEGQILELLDRYAPDSVVASNLFDGHMMSGDPHRALARKYGLRLALKRRDAVWLERLFRSAVEDDRFVALQGLGQIGSPQTLKYAYELVRDESWKAVPGTSARCGAIAICLERFEGPPAARLLLLLERDPRFTKEDGEDVREATRLWRRRRLSEYVDLESLAVPDTADRAESARFMGD
ncbi:MAG: hypothetical protein OER88_00935, partial [Planctomycetota bacterium]|nr:hypothetical protein [Planctomycetota bacterium]